MDDREKQQAQPNQVPQATEPPTLETAGATVAEVEPPTEKFSVAPDDPQAPVSGLSEPAAPVPAAKPKKKRLIVAGVVALILVILAGGSALAYNFWYQNPDKVVGDALVNALKAESVSYNGTIDVSDDGQKAKVTFGGSSADGANELEADASFTLNDKDYVLGGGLVVDAKGTLYFKVSGVTAAVEELRTQVPPASQATFDTLIDKVDDQWVSLNASDTKEFSEAYAKMQKCLTEAGQRLRDDNGVMTEISDVYKKHPFITVEKSLGSKDGSLGYSLSADTSRSKEFVAEFKKTKFYEDLHKCDPSISLDEKAIDDEKADKSDVKIEMWVSRWSHEITKVTVSETQNKQKVNAVVEPKFNEKTEIKAPEGSITLEQLKADITELLQSVTAPTAPAATPVEANLLS